ncbi:purine-nucleoside phosphorylase [Thiospirochaeta perfilievii]|uniref:Purine nucleoside phosphorylase n=1 Tax=Thiospirochaeta perfilievii TaxID=252967 RepID=A0A5C1QF01_9SPIO|nr:purine-nucleoside phosphorylase [Thiospirochaeta perfilievii]QEN06141.1 purine-nucleoside phosphorylase [Thiospirochaeta perfilievii]
MKDLENIKKAAEYIKSKVDVMPTRAIILGSGLGELAEDVKNPVYLNYADIPAFPTSTAPGHKGRLVIGELEGENVLLMQGRFHFYEGYDMDVVVFPVRTMKMLGITDLIVTNAAGGVNTTFAPGDLMLISDHLSMFCTNPLIGPNYKDFGPRFNDMSDPYSKESRKKVHEIAKKSGLTLKEGIYAYMTGPSYETPGEIKALRTLGADAVGMSTVPETTVAVHAGIRVLGISCITNMAAGILDQPLDGDEVIETGQMVKEKFSKLIIDILKSDVM